MSLAAPMATGMAGAPGRWRTTATGALLCGGRSSRMGVDKALLVASDGRTLLERARAALESVAGEVVLCCGPSPRYESLGLPLVLDLRADGGPLAGLEAALERCTTRRLAVLACDMPHAGAQTLAELLERAEADDLDVCMLATDAGVEPLCAVYSRDCLGPVRAALDAGERRMIAFHGLRAGGRPLRIASIAPRDAGAAKNLNTPSDWDDFQRGPR